MVQCGNDTLNRPTFKIKVASSFFLALLGHFQTKKKFIKVLLDGYSLLGVTIREGTNQQRSVRGGTVHAGLTFVGGKCLVRPVREEISVYFFLVENTRVGAAWRELSGGICPGGTFRGKLSMGEFT